MHTNIDGGRVAISRFSFLVQLNLPTDNAGFIRPLLHRSGLLSAAGKKKADRYTPDKFFSADHWTPGKECLSPKKFSLFANVDF